MDLLYTVACVIMVSILLMGMVIVFAFVHFCLYCMVCDREKELDEKRKCVNK